MEVNNPWMIFFIMVVIISIISTAVVLIHLSLHITGSDLKYLLLVLLHSSLILEDISTLPYLWNLNSTLCEIMGWLHYYSGFANIIAVTLLGFHYLSYLISTFPTKINRWIWDYGVYVTLFLPLITLLPFSTRSFGPSHDSWCSLPTDDNVANHWALGVFYSWVLLCLCINTLQLSAAIWKVYKQDLEHIRKSLFSSIGLYVIITFVCWLPRAIPRALHTAIDFNTSDLFYLLTTIPLYLSGMGCSAVYFMDVRINPHGRSASTSYHTDGSSIDAKNLAELFGISSVSENPLFPANGALRSTVVLDHSHQNIVDSL